ncbi:MAG: thiolase family protein [Planctomycetota bacterium]
MGSAVILEAVRTPFARVNGAYREIRSEDLLAHALAGLLARSPMDASKVEDVVTGCVSQVGEQGGNVSRMAALLAGLPVDVPAVSVNRWCGSSQQAIHFAAQSILAGDARCAIACGVESMTRVPIYSDVGGIDKVHPLARARFDLVHQGESGERIATQWKITRPRADAYGMESMRRAAEAARNGLHLELLLTEGKDPEGNPWIPKRDEGIRDTIDPVKVANLKPAYRPVGEGVLTAANSSQFADGASAVLLADEEWAKSEGYRPRARLRSRVVAAGDPSIALMAVVPATEKALARAGLSIADIDWIEINEAFSTVVLAWADEVGANLERVNPWGGAIAHGHAIGATGGGLMAKMIVGLENTAGRFGLQVMTIGHGQATATVVERVE